jgi:hypothetical protein
MMRIPLLAGLLAVIAGPASATTVKIVSPSIIEIGEPVEAAERAEADRPVGFVPTVPPAPGAEKKVEKPKVVSNPPVAAGIVAPAVSGGIPPTSDETTSAIGGDPEAGGDGQSAGNGFDGMEMRLN